MKSKKSRKKIPASKLKKQIIKHNSSSVKKRVKPSKQKNTKIQPPHKKLKVKAAKLEMIQTTDAPAAIGSYSQAIKVGQAVYLSGQIPLDPVTMQLVEGGIEAQVNQVFVNLKNVAEAAQGSMDKIVRISVYLLDLSHVTIVNEAMKSYFGNRFPARTTIGVAALPRGSAVEIDAIMYISS